MTFFSTLAICLVGGLLSIVGALLIASLNSLKKSMSTINLRIDKQDDRIADINKKFSECKIDCDRSNVSKEDWVRSEGYTRQKIEQVTEILLELNGKIKIIEQMPEVIGKITREVVNSLKGSSNG